MRNILVEEVYYTIYYNYFNGDWELRKIKTVRIILVEEVYYTIFYDNLNGD